MLMCVAVCGFRESLVSHHHFTLFCTAAHLMYMLWLLTCQAFLHRFISSRVRIKPYISQRNDSLEKKNKQSKTERRRAHFVRNVQRIAFVFLIFNLFLMKYSTVVWKKEYINTYIYLHTHVRREYGMTNVKPSHFINKSQSTTRNIQVWNIYDDFNLLVYQMYTLLL